MIRGVLYLLVAGKHLANRHDHDGDDDGNHVEDDEDDHDNHGAGDEDDLARVVSFHDQYLP